MCRVEAGELLKKILIVSNGLRAVYNFRKELIEGLLKENYQIYISAPMDSYGEIFEKMGCIVVDTKVDRRGTNPIKDAALIMRYFKLLQQVKPDLTLCFTAKPMVYCGLVCGFFKLPFFAYIEGIGTTFTTAGIKGFLIKKLFQIGLHSCTQIVFMNDENADFFKKSKLLKKQNYKFIRSTGVNLQEFVKTPYPAEAGVEFTFISRILKEKGIDIYLWVAKKVKEKHPDAVFHVVGELEEQQEYKEILEDYHKAGIIDYIGLVQDVKPIIGRSHCILSPSYYGEGRNTVLQEACAMARPIIATDIVGCRESVVEGVNGYLVPPKEKEAFLEAVERFIALPLPQKQEMSRQAGLLAEREMDREKYVKIWMELIKEYTQECDAVGADNQRGCADL